MVMDEGMDTGDILLKAELPIGTEETNETLRDQLALLGAQLLTNTLREMRAGNLRPVPQDHSKATYAPPLKKEDGRIDWNKEAKEIDRRVRALNPWPGTFTRWNGRLLKIFRGMVREGVSKGKAGMVSWAGSDFIEVETGKDFFLIKEVQLEGKKRMGAREFLVGNPVSVGTIFS
jgi:methionyl-tRNA formyltransferase